MNQIEMTSLQSTNGQHTPDPDQILEAERTYEQSMKWRRFILRCVGLWPKQSHWSKLTCWSYDIYAYAICIFVVYLYLTLYHTMRDVWGDLFATIEVFSVILSASLACQKAFRVLLNRQKIDEINNGMRELWIDGWCNNRTFVRSLMTKSSFTVRNATIIYVTPFVLTVFTYPVGPYTSIIAQRKANVSEENLVYVLPYMIQFPWLDMNNSITYGIAYATAATAGFIPMFWISGIDTFYLAYLSQICLQLELLAIEFNNVINNEDTRKLRGLNHADGLKVQKLRLYECIRKHKTIIRMGELMEELFSQVMLGIWVISTLSMCAIMFQGVMSTKHGNRIQFIFFFFYEMGQVFMFCWFGEAVLQKSSSLSQEIYCSKWYNLEKTLWKDLMIVMRRAQRPICITAGGFTNVSLELCTTIWSTTISYFALLRKLHSTT